MSVSVWFKNNKGAPFVGVIGGKIDKLLAAARERGAHSIRATYRRSCPSCGGNMIQDGAIATGLPLEHYTPAYGEVLKNHYMECDDCGFEQGS